MNANTETTLVAIHDGIAAAIRAQFPELVTVAAYPLDRGKIATPACLIELTDFEPVADEDPGTGQLTGYARFEARFVIGFRQPDILPGMEIRRLALAFAAFAHKRRWGCPIGAAEVLGAFPDHFDPELDQYEVWRVEWRQLVDLGETVWKPGGATPATVWVGAGLGGDEPQQLWPVEGL